MSFFTPFGGVSGFIYLLASLLAIFSSIATWWRKMKKELRKRRKQRNERMNKNPTGRS